MLRAWRLSSVAQTPVPPANPLFTSTWLVYARNGTAIVYVLGEEWRWDENPAHYPDDDTYAIHYGREFRYDGAKERYLTRRLDTDELLLGNVVELPEGTYWSDYDGGEIYGDFTANDELEEITNVRSFQLGMARVLYDELGIPTTEYYHADMVGSTRIMTDGAGNGFDEAAYTAFGQLQFAGTAHRSGYAGAWGYQAPASDNPSDPYLAFPFLHVGHRYYDPTTGRFLQRDPIGLLGGINVYDYVGGGPTRRVDPAGLRPFGGSRWDFHPNWPKQSSPEEIVDAMLCGAAVGGAASLAFLAILKAPELISILIELVPDPPDRDDGMSPFVDDDGNFIPWEDDPVEPDDGGGTTIPMPQPEPEPIRKAAFLWNPECGVNLPALRRGHIECVVYESTTCASQV